MAITTHDDEGEGQLAMMFDHERIMHLPGVALAAARKGNVDRADAVELAHIRRTQTGVTLADGRVQFGTPQRLIRAYGQAGQLAVEWCTMDGMVYTDIDGKEI
jgi:hypothetical protein